MEKRTRPSEEDEVRQLVKEREKLLEMFKGWVEKAGPEKDPSKTSLPVVVMFIDPEPPFPIAVMPLPDTEREALVAGLNHMGVRAVLMVADAKKKDPMTWEQIGSGIMVQMFLPDGGLLASFWEYAWNPDGTLTWTEGIKDAHATVSGTLYDKAWRKEIIGGK